MKTSFSAMNGFASTPVVNIFQASTRAPGSAEMMFTMMMMDVPLPMPRSVI